MELNEIEKIHLKYPSDRDAMKEGLVGDVFVDPENMLLYVVKGFDQETVTLKVFCLKTFKMKEDQKTAHRGPTVEFLKNLHLIHKTESLYVSSWIMKGLSKRIADQDQIIKNFEGFADHLASLLSMNGKCLKDIRDRIIELINNQQS